MRLRSALSLGLAAALIPVCAATATAATAGAAGTTAPEAALPFATTATNSATATIGAPRTNTEPPTTNTPTPLRPPTCDTPNRKEFPAESRIHGGPDTYQAGGAVERWELELTNTSELACGNIHPVVVLVDRDRELKSAQVQLEFQDPDGHWHPVTFEESDADEYIGVFADDPAGFSGFSIAPGRTLTVPVRLGFTSDTEANEVTATVALVQRRDGDGDWVGESGRYRFTISPHSGTAGRLPGELAGTGSTTPPGSTSSGRVLLGLGAAVGTILLGGACYLVGSRRRRNPVI